MNKKEKQEITEQNCIDVIMEHFPNSKTFFSRNELANVEDYEENFEPPLKKSLHGEMSEFSHYVAELLEKDTDPQYIRQIFDFIEYLLSEGDDMVQNAAATCFLENILNRTPQVIKPQTFVPFLGKLSREFCKGWDNFTGVYTEGLWDDESPPKT